MNKAAICPEEGMIRLGKDPHFWSEPRVRVGFIKLEGRLF